MSAKSTNKGPPALFHPMPKEQPENSDIQALFEPYAALTTANHAAQGQERGIVQSILDIASEELEKLDSLSSWIESRRNAIKKFSRGYEGFLSPMRRVPDEVLREIMLQCVAENWMGGGVSPAWRLVQVCGRWRTIAKSTPSLWSYISVDSDVLDVDMANTLEVMVDEMLALSKSSPLSVELAGVEMKTMCWEIWQMIFECSERINYLSLIRHPGDELTEEDFPYPFPTLQTLELYEINSGLDFFKPCPQVKTVYLSNIGPTWRSYLELQLPLTQVTSLAIQHTEGDVRPVVATLQTIVGLEELTFSIGQAVSLRVDRLPTEVVKLLKLKRFSFRAAMGHSATNFLLLLFLPALEELMLDVEFNEDFDRVDDYAYGRFYGQVTSLVKTSRCNIKRFSLVDPGRLYEFHGLLQSMSQLETFRYFATLPLDPMFVIPEGHVDGLISTFTRGQDDEKASLPFPRLRLVDIQGVPLNKIGKSILQLLSERLGTEMETFHMLVPNSVISMDPSDLTMYARLSSGSVNISIRSDPAHFKAARKSRVSSRNLDIHPIYKPPDDFLWTKLDGYLW